MTPGPTTTIRTVDPHPWTPCRRHLFETLAAIAPNHRTRTTWLISSDVWAAIRRDPDLRGDWHENPATHLANRRTLLGAPVTLVDTATRFVTLALNVNCRPETR